MAVTFDSVLKDLNAKKYKPLYFLCGEEPFFIDSITQKVEDIIPEDEKAFNQTILYGNDVNMTAVTDSARRFPMMAERQVIIVKEAQNIKDFDKLIPYLKHLQSTTILLFAYKNKKADKRKAAFKELSTMSDCVYFESDRLYDDKVANWIMNYCKSNNISISIKAATILADSLGTDLSRVVNEIDKLSLLIPQGTEIKEALVEEHTGISKDFNIFELQSAIIKLDHLKANRIVNYFEANPLNNPLVVTIATLFKYFLNLLTYHYQKKSTPNSQDLARQLGVHPYFMKDFVDGSRIYGAAKCAENIHLMREYDLKSKGVNNAGTPEGELLRELVFKIMH
ncbi:DNA polymerase III subunit delta [Bacteroidia bacterium]|nr:DNA polymerase III subunit delta [Bacteroidia bacterium]